MADNPFAGSYNAILDPNQGGTIMGAIGGMLGAPTARQASGAATGRALQELSALKEQNGGNPQQALLKWFQTPSGQDYFTNAGPDGLKALVDGLQATQAPAPTLHNVAEGGQLYATNPGSADPRLVASNPKRYPNTTLGPQDKMFDANGQQLAENTNIKGDEPADIKSFKFFAQVNGTNAADLKRIAGLKLDPSSVDKTTVASQSIDEMVTAGRVSPELGQALKAGTIKVLPVKNEFGQDTGAISVYDMSNPSAGVQLLSPQAGSPPNAKPAPGTNADSGAATGVLPAAKPAPAAPQLGPDGKPIPQKTTAGNKAFGTKEDMALGAGPVSKVLGTATKLSEAIDPRLIIEQGAQANDRATMLGTLRSNLQSIGTIGGGLSSNKGLIEGYVKTYLDQGFFDSSPHSQVQKLIRLHEVATKNIEDETARYHDKNLPNEVKKQAAETVAGWQRVLGSMPTYDTLIKQEKDIREGKAGAPTVSGAANAIIGAGSKALTETKKQITDVQNANPGLAGAPNIDTMSDQELLAVDPRTLPDRTSKIKLLRRLDTLSKGGAKRGVK